MGRPASQLSRGFSVQARRKMAQTAGLFVERRSAMKWITREHVKVDRVACPWLIKKFIDPDAEFLFVPAGEVSEAAKRHGAVPFDVAGVELGHHEGRCSFEAILTKYRLDDP